jgi:mRNA interferase RelE/StbE
VSYRVEIAGPARTDIRRLSGYLRAQALSLISALAREPRPPRAKELRDKPGIYRIWLAGRWRIAYEVDDEDHRILVLRVRSKDRMDYDSLTSWIHETEAGYDTAYVGAGTREDCDVQESPSPKSPGKDTERT